MTAAALVLLVVVVTYYVHCVTIPNPPLIAAGDDTERVADDTDCDDADWWAW